MSRLSKIVLAAALCLSVEANAAWIGQVTGATNVQTPPANNKAVSPYTPQYSGTLVAITITYSSASGLAKAVVYDNTGAGGKPGALLGQSIELTPTAGRVKYTFATGIPLTAGTTYYFGIWSNTQSVSQCLSQTNGIYFNSDTYSSGGSPSNPFGSSPSAANFIYPLFGIYNITLNPLNAIGYPNFGDGTVVSSYAANVEAVARLGVHGTVSSIVLFLSAASATARVTGALYDATGSGGSPGNRIGTTNELVGTIIGANTLTFPSPVSVNGLIFFGDNTNTALTTFIVNSFSSGVVGYTASSTYSSTPPNPFPGGAALGTTNGSAFLTGTFINTSSPLLHAPW